MSRIGRLLGSLLALAAVPSVAFAAPGDTTLVSVSSDGTQGNANSYDPSISADRRFVAFDSYAANLVAGDTNNSSDIFVHDRQTGVTERVSVSSDGTPGNGNSWDPPHQR